MNFMIIHEKESQLMYNKKVRIFRKQVKKSWHIPHFTVNGDLEYLVM